LEVASEDLLEIFPAIDRALVQVVKPGPSHIGYVNGKELDDEEVIIRPSCPARKLVVLQSHARVSFAIILDDVVWCPKAL
jgi:hypothetical protein